MKDSVLISYGCYSKLSQTHENGHGILCPLVFLPASEVGET